MGFTQYVLIVIAHTHNDDFEHIRQWAVNIETRKHTCNVLIDVFSEQQQQQNQPTRGCSMNKCNNYRENIHDDNNDDDDELCVFTWFITIIIIMIYVDWI